MTRQSSHRYHRAAVAAAALVMVQFAGCQRDGRASANRWNLFAKASRRQPASTESSLPVKLDANQKANVKMVMARSLERKGRTDEAIKVYSDVIRKDGRRADAYHRLAVLHDKKGACRDSLEYYRQALKADPDNAEAHCDLGYSCYLQQRWKEAETYLRKALTLDPELKRAHNNLGMVLARTGRFDEALTEFRWAGCTAAEARANLAFVLMFEERWDESQRQFQLALTADPSSKVAQDGLNALHSFLDGSPRNKAALAAHQRDEEHGITWSVLDKELIARIGGLAEYEGILDHLRNLQGTEVAILFRDLGGSVKISLRSSGVTDVASVARALGGGGHEKAAGAEVEGDLAEVTGRVLEACRAAISEGMSRRS